MHFVNTDGSNKVVIYFESSSICVFSGSVVRPAGYQRSDRRHRGGQTGEATAVKPVVATGSGRRSRWFDQSSYFGQTDVHQVVRPAHILQSGRDPSIRG